MYREVDVNCLTRGKFLCTDRAISCGMLVGESLFCTINQVYIITKNDAQGWPGWPYTGTFYNTTLTLNKTFYQRGPFLKIILTPQTNQYLLLSTQIFKHTQNNN